MENIKKRSYTYPEFLSTFMPNFVLLRMEESLMKHFKLDAPWQHRLEQTEGDPKTGSVEVAKRGECDQKWIRNWLSNFYQMEGYIIEKGDDKLPLKVSLKEQKYLVEAFNFETSILINVISQ